MPVSRFLLPLSICLSVAGCFTTKVVNIGQKTSLEKQLMGEAEPLTEEELLVSSVRAPGGGLSVGSVDDSQSRALSARRRQLFNRDDLEELKAAGCLGEGGGARLVSRPCNSGSAPDSLKERDRLIREENADRGAIINWALAVDPVLTPADRPQVVELYRHLIADRARPGDWIRSDEGVWSKR